MLKFKNVIIEYHSDLLDRKYEKKKRKMMASSVLIAFICMLDVLAASMLINSALCIIVAVLAVFSTIFIGTYIASSMIYSDSDNVSLYNYINNLKYAKDIYAGIYDGNILIRITDNDDTKYYSLSCFSNINGITEEIIDESNGSTDIKLHIIYSFNKVCITIKEA